MCSTSLSPATLGNRARSVSATFLLHSTAARQSWGWKGRKIFFAVIFLLLASGYGLLAVQAQAQEVGGVDTDGDGYADEVEVRNGYSPRHGDKKRLREVDSDNDGLWDDWEIALGTDLLDPDTDGDGYKDGQEVMAGYDPRARGGEKLEKRIEVNLKAQKLVYFFGEVKLDEFLISSGLPRTPTPVGQFTVLQKRPVVHYKGPGYDYPNTKWNLVFKRGRGYNYYIHGAYWHNQFGTRRSAGCVNVPYEYAYMGRLYDWAAVGTKVSIR